ncbi:hypothetical protein Tco_0884932 [Tanacetum coccineum]
MSFITAQQTKLDLELVPKEKTLEIGKCNGRLNLGKKQREPTFQVVLDALALTSCYSAFLTTADVPEVYMHQLWDTIHKYDTSYRVYGQNFDEFPTDEVIVSFFKKLGHTGEIKSITDKSLDKLRLSRAQILWGMYYKKNVDYVELLWEDFTYHIDNKAYKKQEKMYYPRFTKVIIHYFLTKDKTISWRYKIGMHTSRDDYLINTLRFVSANEVSQRMKPIAIVRRFGVSVRNCLDVVVSKFIELENAPSPMEKLRKIQDINLSQIRQCQELMYSSSDMLSLSSLDIRMRNFSPYIRELKDKLMSDLSRGVSFLLSDVTEENYLKVEADSWGRDENERWRSDVPSIETALECEGTRLKPMWNQRVRQRYSHYRGRNCFSMDDLLHAWMSTKKRVSALEKEVSELRMDDPLNTQVTALVDEHLESRLGATKDEFMNYLLASITARITEQVKI